MTVPSLPKFGTPPAPAPLRKIALEEHFGHPIVFMRHSDGRFETRKEAAVGHLGPEYFEVVQQRLLDFDTTRLQAMDEAGNLGDLNFEDGIALPGWILEEFPETYVAGELRDGHGNIVPGTNRLTADTTTTHVAFVSNKRVLGGLLAGEILQPLVDLDAQLANGTSSRVRGFGDMIFGPGIQWTPKKIGESILPHRFVFINRPSGIKVTFRISKTVPTKESQR
jgi:hypothetical protein